MKKLLIILYCILSICADRKPDFTAMADAGPNQNIFYPTNTLTVDGSSSTTTVGTITSYVWSQVSGPSVAVIANPNVASTTISVFVIGTYVFQLNVVASDNSTASAQMTITLAYPSGVNILKPYNHVRLINL